MGADEIDVRQILSDPDIEGDPLQFLKVTEAYWKVQTGSCLSCFVSCLALQCWNQLNGQCRLCDWPINCHNRGACLWAY